MPTAEWMIHRYGHGTHMASSPPASTIGRTQSTLNSLFQVPKSKKVIYSIDRILNKVRNELKHPHTILLAPLSVPPLCFSSFSQHLCNICSCSQEFSPDWKEMITCMAVCNVHYWTKHSVLQGKKQLILSEKEFREDCPKEVPLWTETWIMNKEISRQRHKKRVL